MVQLRRAEGLPEGHRPGRQGTLWTLSKSQAKGVQSALEMGCSSYGELVFQCDKRRAEHQVVATHYSKALPEDDLWQTGCIAIRQPSVQQQLIQNGVPQTLLNQFSRASLC